MGVLPTAAVADVPPIYQTLVDGLDLGVLVLDARGAVLSANPGAARLLGVDHAALDGAPALPCTFVDGAQLPLAPSGLPWARALADGAPQLDVTLGVARPDGDRVWLAAGARPTGHAGVAVAVVTLSDVTAQRDEIARLRELAERDHVTGLPGRAHLEAALAAEQARCARDGGSAGVLLVALDGPRAADAPALREAARRLGADLRRVDVLTHLGGGVFAVVLPGGAAEDAERAAGRLLEILSAPGARDGPAPRPAAATVVLTGEDDPAAVLGRASAALGRARREEPAGPGDGSTPRGVRAPALVERIFETVGRESGRLGMDRICGLVRELLGVDIAYATEHDASHQHFRALAGDGASFGVGATTSMPLEATYCQAILEGRLPPLMGDLREHPVALAMPVTAAARVAAYVSVPIRDAAGCLRGTLCGASHTARPDLSDRDVSFLHVLAAVLAHHLEADDALDRRATAASARALASAVELRDRYTADHSAEVVELATAVGRAMGLAPDELRAAQQVALLHDIGKLGISDAILHKPGPLTPDERRVMETHPDLGAAIITTIPELGHLADAIRAEHERWDGRGYPRGLAGAAIPLASRITFVCDAFHAMTSDRPYRRAMSVADALAEVRRERGAQFCPAVVDGLLAVLDAGAPPAGD